MGEQDMARPSDRALAASGQAPAGLAPSGFDPSRLGYHVADNLRWLAEQPSRPGRVPCGMLTGSFLLAVAERYERLARTEDDSDRIVGWLLGQAANADAIESDPASGYVPGHWRARAQAAIDAANAIKRGDHLASAIEARRAETRSGSVADESAVGEAETPNPHQVQP